MASVEEGIVAGMFAANAIQAQSRARIGLMQAESRAQQAQSDADRVARQLAQVKRENEALQRDNDTLKRELANVRQQATAEKNEAARVLSSWKTACWESARCASAGNMTMNAMFAVLGELEGGEALIRAIGQKALARMREVDLADNDQIEATFRTREPEKAARLGM